MIILILEKLFEAIKRILIGTKNGVVLICKKTKQVLTFLFIPKKKATSASGKKTTTTTTKKTVKGR